MDEINSKISKEKLDKESFIHNKISNTEIILKTNNENCLKKINEIKNNIKSLYNFFDQIKLFTKKNSEETEQILDSFENKFNIRIKEEENKRINLEKKLKNLIDTKFNDMKYKISEKREEKIPQLNNKKETSFINYVRGEWLLFKSSLFGEDDFKSNKKKENKNENRININTKENKNENEINTNGNKNENK